LKSMRELSLLWLLGVNFVLLSAGAGAGWLHGTDVSLMRAAQDWPSDFLYVAFGFLSAFGSLEVTGGLLLALAAALFLGGRRRLAGRLLLAFLATGLLLEYLLKQLLPVPPVPAGFVRTEDFAPLIAAGHPYPYPSGHALRSTILLGAVYLLSTSGFLRAGIALVLLGLLASRVYLGTHWTSDVVGGALLGATAVLWAFERTNWRRRSPW
jgi:membrane-associated phospholipid phosphatase